MLVLHQGVGEHRKEQYVQHYFLAFSMHLPMALHLAGLGHLAHGLNTGPPLA